MSAASSHATTLSLASTEEALAHATKINEEFVAEQRGHLKCDNPRCVRLMKSDGKLIKFGTNRFPEGQDIFMACRPDGKARADGDQHKGHYECAACREAGAMVVTQGWKCLACVSAIELSGGRGGRAGAPVAACKYITDEIVCPKVMALNDATYRAERATAAANVAIQDLAQDERLAANAAQRDRAAARREELRADPERDGQSAQVAHEGQEESLEAKRARKRLNAKNHRDRELAKQRQMETDLADSKGQVQTLLVDLGVAKLGESTAQAKLESVLLKVAETFPTIQGDSNASFAEYLALLHEAATTPRALEVVRARAAEGQGEEKDQGEGQGDDAGMDELQAILMAAEA